MRTIEKNTPEVVISKRREQVRREWSSTERQVRKLAASIAQQQLYLLIAGRSKPMAG